MSNKLKENITVGMSLDDLEKYLRTESFVFEKRYLTKTAAGKFEENRVLDQYLDANDAPLEEKLGYYAIRSGEHDELRLLIYFKDQKVVDVSEKYFSSDMEYANKIFE